MSEEKIQDLNNEAAVYASAVASNEDEETNKVVIHRIFATIFSLAFFLSFCAVIIYYLFSTYTDDLIKKDIETSSNLELQKVRAYETQQLNSYGFVNEEKTIVRVPVKSVVDEVVAAYKKR